eukprot:gene20764-24890_t
MRDIDVMVEELDGYSLRASRSTRRKIEIGHRCPQPLSDLRGCRSIDGDVKTFSLDDLEKDRQREKLERKYGRSLPYTERDSPVDEELLHALAREQTQEEVEDGLLQRARDLATKYVARAAKDKVIQVVLYPPDHPPRDFVQTATAQGLLADAGTYELPWDPDDLIYDDPPSKDDPIECKLNSITDTVDMSP